MAKEARPEVGYTGARFGGGRTRRSAVTPVPPAGEAEPDAQSPRIGYTGARFGGATRRSARGRAPQPASGRSPDPEPIADPRDVPAAPSADRPPHRPEQDLETATEPVAGTESVRVRPYVFTGGRTRGRIELHLETLVSAGPRPPREHHAVVELCRRPVSVAEVAALMNVPIGVSRVVLGDLAAQGAVTVHEAGVQDVPELAFLERVLTGLRRL